MILASADRAAGIRPSPGENFELYFTTRETKVEADRSGAKLPDHAWHYGCGVRFHRRSGTTFRLRLQRGAKPDRQAEMTVEHELGAGMEQASMSFAANPANVAPLAVSLQLMPAPARTSKRMRVHRVPIAMTIPAART